MTTFEFEDLQHIKKIRYICKKHGIIFKPINNEYYIAEKDGKISPGFDVYCPACISEYYMRKVEEGELSDITYEAEYEEGYTPKSNRKKAGEIEG